MGKAEYIKSNAAGNKLLLEPANKRGRGHKKCPPSAKKKKCPPQRPTGPDGFTDKLF